MDVRDTMHRIDLAEYHRLIRINNDICPLALSGDDKRCGKRIGNLASGDERINY